ncbi:MAG: pantetheine-phosphate adenylyltransferase [Acidimicrobiaceae bacterium]|nr:pantetheine-phosphate adenylyltransferase [Acidimicrobiaceae bacterium]
MKVMFPGSFDPVHLGHLDIITQAATLFDEVVVAVMHNPEKPSGMFSVNERVEMIKSATSHIKAVTVHVCAGLAVDAAKTLGANCIVKSVRNVTDLDIEVQMAYTNSAVGGIQTVLLIPQPANAFISSRYVREVAHYGGNVSSLVPNVVDTAITKAKGR